jgi:hypothetical protein
MEMSMLPKRKKSYKVSMQIWLMHLPIMQLRRVTENAGGANDVPTFGVTLILCLINYVQLVSVVAG